MLALLWTPASVSAACDTAAADWPQLQPVSPNVWRVAAARGDPVASNRGVTTQLVLVRDGARLWLIGSGPTPAFGSALACAVRRTTGRAVTDIVNTRAAPELALGNVAFERPANDVTIPACRYGPSSPTPTQRQISRRSPRPC